MYRKYRVAFILISSILLFFADGVSAQSELAPWGNILGIRRHGQFYDFETSIKVEGENGKRGNITAKEAQRPHYNRDSKDQQTVTTNIDNLYFKETVKDKCSGKINVALQINAKADTVLNGIFLCISLPEREYLSGKLRWISVAKDSIGESVPLAIFAKGFSVVSAQRNFKILFNSAMPMFVRKDTSRGNNILVSIMLFHGAMNKGDSLQTNFSIKASGEVDKQPVNITVDTTRQGRAFAGFGGNFRLQYPKTDPEVIDYCLNNLRVAWGRVEMPWRFWQPKQNMSPLDSAKVAMPVQKAMEMAQRLSKMNIPIILTAWAPPAWAIIGKPHFRPINGVWGNPLNPDSTQAIYKSITDYIIYLKNHYGVDIKLFSFNESDLGINIRVTPEEHDVLIKGLGAYFAAHGLQTKMLLGDNSDATTYQFIYPALNDPEARQYIGAISFHSWRGWDTPTLEKWAEAATRSGLPLIVGEGSTDAQAYGYPQIFQESTYALQEINLYTRILNICQPVTILQWQLTTDYSPLIGGDVYGDDKEPLHAGQRFYNLKQLASTPASLFAMPVSSSAKDVSCAALGDNAKGIYTIHLVNNGTTREVTVTGLPANIKVLHFYTTNQKLYMADGAIERQENGKIVIKLPSVSYCTLVGITK